MIWSFSLNPDNRPQNARFRVDTPTFFGVNTQRFFGSKCARRFTREEVASMAAMQNMIAFPYASKLGIDGKLNPKKGTESELRGEKLFTDACAPYHAAPYYTNNSAHDLQVERFYEGRAEGLIKTFSVRGFKDLPPYLHGGRLLTLEDPVEFFNLILEADFNQQQKTDLVAFLRAL